MKSVRLVIVIKAKSACTVGLGSRMTAT